MCPSQPMKPLPIQSTVSRSFLSLPFLPPSLPATAVKDRKFIRDKAAAIKIVPFTPRAGVTIHTTDSEAAAAASGTPGQSVTAS